MSNFPTNISQVKIKIGEETSSPIPLTISEEQIEEIKTDIQEIITPEIESIKAKNHFQEKKITVLESLTNYETKLDNFIEYTVLTSINAPKVLQVSKIGGMTYRDEATNTLKDAKVTSIESRGANMIIYPYVLKTTENNNGVAFTVNDDGTVIANGTATNGIYAKLADVSYSAGETYTLSGCPIGGSSSKYSIYDDLKKYYDYGSGVTFTESENTMGAIYLRIAKGTVLSNVVFKPMLNRGAKAQPYSKFGKVIDSLAIPEAVQALNGYGLGINADCYNYIDWEKKQFVQNVGKYTLTGAEKVTKSSVQTLNGLNVYYISPAPFDYYLEVSILILADKYKYNGRIDSGNRFKEKEYPNDTMYAYYNYEFTNRSLYFVSDAADKETFKQSIAGMTVLYKLAEPIVTDISNLLPEDNFIEIEGGGTIVAVNENEIALPIELIYYNKIETATLEDIVNLFSKRGGA